MPTRYPRYVAMTPRLSNKITAIAESATLKVDSKAKALKAQGAPVISYAAGEPDFATPEHIVEAALVAARDPKNHRYTPAKGLPDLREAVAAKTLRDSKFEAPADNVLITNGGKQSVYESFQVLLNPGDEVIVPTPYWTTYPEVIALADGVAVDVFADAAHGYKVTLEQLESARTPRTKVLLFVSPSNPTGAVYSPEETREIGEWALAHGIWIITDEIYQNLTYDGVEATSIVGAVPELAEQTLVVNGVAKSYAMTGWRVGWTVGPKDAITAMTNLQSHLSGNVNNIAQRAAVAALTGSQEPVEQMRQAFDRRRHAIVEQLNLVNGFSVPTPKGAFYVYADVSGVIGREIDGVTPRSSLEVADLMLEKAQVAAVPGEAFGPSGYLRFSYALGDDALREGAERLQKLFA